MDDLNDLSNEELQYRLAQFGSPAIPVTATTRKVLLKKLRNLIETEKSKLRRDTDYATRYSSDEDVSAIGIDSKVKTAKGRSRSTVSAAARLASQQQQQQQQRRTNLNMPPPSTTTQQKSPTSIWIDKNQMVKFVDQLFFGSNE